MKRKIFISINLDNRTKKSLGKAIGQWLDLPVKWVKEPNLHITLAFLGFVPDSDISGICETVMEAVKDSEMLDLQFDKIELGPDKKDPKNIWLIGEPDEQLRLLQEKIEKSLGTYITSKKLFRPHITLGRIRQHKWQDLENIPEIDKKFPLTVTAESVDIMASEFDQDDMEYVIIESCPLK